MRQKKQTTADQDAQQTEADRFRDFVKQVVSVPKEEIDKREAEYQKERAALKQESKKEKDVPIER